MKTFDFTDTRNWDVLTRSLFTDTDSEFAQQLLTKLYLTLDDLDASSDPDALQHAWRVLLVHMRERLLNDPHIADFCEDKWFVHDAWGLVEATRDG